MGVVIAVRNERAFLRRRVENLLAQDYPPDLLKVIVACNGSVDGTLELAQQLAASNPRVRLVTSPTELGKAGALNAGVAEADDAEVVLFADARQTFAPDVVARLTACLDDPTVGLVSGRLVIPRADVAPVEGVRLYWGMEMRLREAESRSGSVVQALGAIYAIRRPLFEPIPPNLILDDVFVAMQIAMKGYRIVMEPDAIGYDEPARNPGSEFSRKRRTMVGNIQLLRAVPQLLSPAENPIFLRFVSHKLLRVCSPFCFVSILLVSAMLPQPVYRVAFVGELGLYIAGAFGLIVSLPALSVPSAFVLMHAAIFAAAWGWKHDAAGVWHPRRLASAPDAEENSAASHVISSSTLPAARLHRVPEN